MRGVSDLCNGDRKLAGSSLRLWAGRVLYQVSVLVDVDVSLIERYLALPSRQPDYRAGRSHRDFVVTLRELGCGVSREEAAASLHRHLTEAGVPLRAAGPDV
jgi:lipoate-protein ligase A